MPSQSPFFELDQLVQTAILQEIFDGSLTHSDLQSVPRQGPHYTALENLLKQTKQEVLQLKNQLEESHQQQQLSQQERDHAQVTIRSLEEIHHQDQTILQQQALLLQEKQSQVEQLNRQGLEAHQIIQQTLETLQQQLLETQKYQIQIQQEKQQKQDALVHEQQLHQRVQTEIQKMKKQYLKLKEDHEGIVEELQLVQQQSKSLQKELQFEQEVTAAQGTQLTHLKGQLEQWKQKTITLESQLVDAHLKESPVALSPDPFWDERPDKRREALRLLGLPDQANVSDIKKQYKELAMFYYPDQYTNHPKQRHDLSEKRMREINGAYAQLQESLGFR